MASVIDDILPEEAVDEAAVKTASRPPLQSGDQLSADQFLSVDTSGWELIDGTVVEKTMSGQSSWIGLRVASDLLRYADDTGGWAFGDGTEFRCFGPEGETVRKPDAAYIKPGRLSQPPAVGAITLVPDLAVEVISPHDVMYDVQAKLAMYCDAGVSRVWIVHPQLRAVDVLDCGTGHTQRLTGEAVLSDEAILPGFERPVIRFFPTPESVAGVDETAAG